MNKKMLIFALSVFLVSKAFAQMPSGSRPPQDTNEYIGMFDVTPSENDVDYDSYVFSPSGNVAAFVGTLSNFVKCLNDNLSKKTKEYFEKNKSG